MLEEIVLYSGVDDMDQECVQALLKGAKLKVFAKI